MISVYVLIDTRTDNPFYVGITKNCKQRLSIHKSSRKYFKCGPRLTPTQTRICEIMDEGHSIKMVVLEQYATRKEAKIAENYLIWMLKWDGVAVTNIHGYGEISLNSARAEMERRSLVAEDGSWATWLEG